MFRLQKVLAVTIPAALALAAAPLAVQEMELPRPTQEHAKVQKMVGQWEGTVTMFMPGMPEMAVPATESVRSGGPFWAISDFKSNFMGQPYEGHGCHGYDPKKGKYLGTWVDSMTSTLQIMEGEYDEATKTLVMNWEAPDMTGAMAPHRSEQVAGDDEYKMTFYTSGVKTMVIEMKRTSAKPVEAGSGSMR